MNKRMGNGDEMVIVKKKLGHGYRCLKSGFASVRSSHDGVWSRETRCLMLMSRISLMVNQ